MLQTPAFAGVIGVKSRNLVSVVASVGARFRRYLRQHLRFRQLRDFRRSAIPDNPRFEPCRRHSRAMGVDIPHLVAVWALPSRTCGGWALPSENLSQLSGLRLENWSTEIVFTKIEFTYLSMRISMATWNQTIPGLDVWVLLLFGRVNQTKYD